MENCSRPRFHWPEVKETEYFSFAIRQKCFFFLWLTDDGRMIRRKQNSDRSGLLLFFFLDVQQCNRLSQPTTGRGERGAEDSAREKNGSWSGDWGRWVETTVLRSRLTGSYGTGSMVMWCRGNWGCEHESRALSTIAHPFLSWKVQLNPGLAHTKYNRKTMQHPCYPLLSLLCGHGPPAAAHALGSAGSASCLKIKLPGGRCNQDFFCLNAANLLNRNKCWSADLLLNNHFHSKEQSRRTFWWCYSHHLA